MKNLLLEAIGVDFNHGMTPRSVLRFSQSDRRLKQIEIDHLIVPILLNPSISPGSSTNEIDTLFDPDQRDGINLSPFFSKQNRPERVSNEADVSQKWMSEQGVKFMNHPPAFEQDRFRTSVDPSRRRV
jgi:hypothetical protein